jgi:hypothetical protein
MPLSAGPRSARRSARYFSMFAIAADRYDALRADPVAIKTHQTPRCAAGLRIRPLSPASLPVLTFRHPRPLRVASWAAITLQDSPVKGASWHEALTATVGVRVLDAPRDLSHCSRGHTAAALAPLLSLEWL